MKPNKTILMTIAICTMMALFVVSAHAESAWYECTVDEAGPAWDSVYIRLTDTAATPAFTDKWFTPDPDLRKEMLATALGARLAAVPKNVRVNVDPDDGSYPTLWAMYLQ